MKKNISKQIIKRIAEELLISFKELNGFSSSEVGELYPIYHMNDNTVSYYEVKFISTGFKDNGYAIINANKEDLPVVEFSEKGKTHYERFADIIGHNKFRMIRYGPTFIVAEGNSGDCLAYIGIHPTLKPVKSKDSGLSTRSIIPDINQSKASKHSWSYEAFKKNYHPQKIDKDKLLYHWKIDKSSRSPCLNNYYGVKHPNQLEKGSQDDFTIYSSELGELLKIHIRHDNNGDHPGWYLKDVKITKETTSEEWQFPCNRWLARDEDDGRIDRFLYPNPRTKYLITIRTGNRENAGTDANLYIKIIGSSAIFEEERLITKSNLTENDRSFFKQLRKNSPPNNNNHASGCGPTCPSGRQA